jgi:hypothetical protein
MWQVPGIDSLHPERIPVSSRGNNESMPLQCSGIRVQEGDS